MKEDLLHYLWQHKLFTHSLLQTFKGESIHVKSVGFPNHNSGPDFFNSKIEIGGQLWAGNVEIHIKSSDWYVHNHEVDTNYDNVILHVVWEHDIEVFNSQNLPIQTLELKRYVSKYLLEKYQKLFTKEQKWINCENEISHVDSFVLSNWMERLFFGRLEQKAFPIEELLIKTKHNWEAVLFVLLARNFGLHINADAFFDMASILDFSIVRKESKTESNLESLLFGQLGMLNGKSEEVYFNKLKKEYLFQQKKYKLSNIVRPMVEYFRMRPTNFPTIRISQLAKLYVANKNLFSVLMRIESISGFYNLLSVETSSFWETHYTFDKESPKRMKKLSKPFIDLLLINTIIPLKFVYLNYKGKLEEDNILSLISQLKPEKNNITNKFKSLNINAKNAFESQSLLQLKNEYCTPNKCLKCAIGNYILKH